MKDVLIKKILLYHLSCMTMICRETIVNNELLMRQSTIIHYFIEDHFTRYQHYIDVCSGLGIIPYESE